MEIDVECVTSSSKRHKKHKHKKHKRRKTPDRSEAPAGSSVNVDDKVKSKLTNSSSVIDKSKSNVTKTVDKAIPSTSVPLPTASSSSTSSMLIKPNVVKKKKGRGRDSGTSSEEERWLDAIESGKLEDVDDELKKIKPKDPKLMTARQRAMYERGTDKEISPASEMLMSLPTGYKEKVMTAEAIQKAAIKSQKRKQLADEKREKDKKRTMDRLLKKQETKLTKSVKLRTKRTIPLISYKQNISLTTLSYPENMDYPLQAKSEPAAPPRIKCSIQGCNNLKKYSCSKTNVPLCSLECYQKNATIFT